MITTQIALYLCQLFYFLSMFMISDYICTRVILYIIAICTDGVIMIMCPCLLLVVICALCQWPGMYYYWYISIWTLCDYELVDYCMDSMVSLGPVNSYILKKFIYMNPCCKREYGYHWCAEPCYCQPYTPWNQICIIWNLKKNTKNTYCIP